MVLYAGSIKARTVKPSGVNEEKSRTSLDMPVVFKILLHRHKEGNSHSPEQRGKIARMF